MARPTRERVDAGGRHGDQRRSAAVDGQDGRADLDALGLGGQVAHEARRVEAVGLGDPHHVEADLLELGDLAGGLLVASGVVQRHGDLHEVVPFLSACPGWSAGWGRLGSACQSAKECTELARACTRSIAGMTGESPIDFVLFDLGGVLIDPGGVGPMRELSGLGCEEEVWARWLSCRWVRSFEAGQCSPQEFAVRPGGRLGARPRTGGVLGAVRRLARAALSRRAGSGAGGAGRGRAAAVSPTPTRCSGTPTTRTPRSPTPSPTASSPSSSASSSPTGRSSTWWRRRCPSTAARVSFLDDNAVNVEACGGRRIRVRTRPRRRRRPGRSGAGGRAGGLRPGAMGVG